MSDSKKVDSCKENPSATEPVETLDPFQGYSDLALATQVRIQVADEAWVEYPKLWIGSYAPRD